MEPFYKKRTCTCRYGKITIHSKKLSFLIKIRLREKDHSSHRTDTLICNIHNYTKLYFLRKQHGITTQRTVWSETDQFLRINVCHLLVLTHVQEDDSPMK